jgi:outer membrane protein assembly factor BamE
VRKTLYDNDFASLQYGNSGVSTITRFLFRCLPTTLATALPTALFTASLLLVGTLTGCARDKWGFPYEAPVQQGNWVTQEQVALLRKGMTREQVRFILGSPTLNNVLHAERQDYPYYYKPSYGPAQTRKFTAWFQDNQLVRWEGDRQPDFQPFQLTPSPKAPPFPPNADAQFPTPDPVTAPVPTSTDAPPAAGTLETLPDEVPEPLPEPLPPTPSH